MQKKFAKKSLSEKLGKRICPGHLVTCNFSFFHLSSHRAKKKIATVVVKAVVVLETSFTVSLTAFWNVQKWNPFRELKYDGKWEGGDLHFLCFKLYSNSQSPSFSLHCGLVFA